MAAVGTSPRPVQGAAVLGLTFLFIGLAFALPVFLVPSEWQQQVSKVWPGEVGNVFACTAWAGWAHFVFAFQGQAQALARQPAESRAKMSVLYVLLVVVCALVLLLVRIPLGLEYFSALVWVCFVGHFIKAEHTFDGTPLRPKWLLKEYQPLLTFAWLTAVLLNVGRITDYRWAVWTTSLLLAVLVLYLGGWRRLFSAESRESLLSLFFVGEALVWGTISYHGQSAFLAGVYVFHIAAASVVHYLGSYMYAISRTQVEKRASYIGLILGGNAIVLALGWATHNLPAFKWLAPVLGVQWFTLWVGVHLASSELVPWIKKFGQQQNSA